MSIVGIAVFAAIIAAAMGQGGPYCDPYKGLKYTDCVRCTSTCNDYWYEPNKACFTCNPGCDCADKNSYIRNDGYCVPSDQCFDYCDCNSVAASDSASDDYVPDSCGPDQTYVTQRPCYNTCRDYLDKRACGIRGAGCTCTQPGYYILEENGVCVTATACEIFYSGDSASPALTDDSGPGNYCGPDQIYVNQLPCYNTCGEYIDKGACGIRGPGCTCAQPGYYILESSGLCVQPLICEAFYGGNAAPALTNDDETNSCGPDQTYATQRPCYNTCREYLDKGACGIRGAGCTCTQPGYYILEENGVCVTATACEIFYSGDSAPPALTDDSGPARCDVNEEYSTCAGCVRTCENPNPEVCAAVCRIGCFCKSGYLRNSNNVCVRPEDCDTGNYCGPDQIYVSQLPCYNTCGEYIDKGACGIRGPGCTCAQPGYYILESSGLCVQPLICEAFYGGNAAPALTNDDETSPPLIVCDTIKGQTFYEVLPCVVTCQEYLSPSDVCIERGMGCACAQEGYYILEDIGFCVPGEVCAAYYSRPAALSCPAASDDAVSDSDVNPCGEDQIYVEQIPCKNTCSDYYQGNDFCIERGPGCTCVQNGYYIREDTGQCVPGWLCPYTECNCSVSK